MASRMRADIDQHVGAVEPAEADAQVGHRRKRKVLSPGIDEGGDVLADHPHAQSLAIEPNGIRDLINQRAELFFGRRRDIGRSIQGVRDLRRPPGPANGSAPDHHPCRPGERQRLARGDLILDVAIGQNWQRGRRNCRCDAAPVGLAVIKLVPRSAMDGDHPRPLALGDARKFRRVERGLIPAEPHLDGDRDADGFHRRCNQAAGKVRFAHQGAARLAARDLFCRTAHVDVDDVGASRLGQCSASAHPFGVAAGELNDEGT